jgi:DNA repair photolyase
VEAVARLNEAGVPCGVLLAPVLPGLSDRRDQLEAVVRACVEAGARSISPVLLHLRPGVREHYLEWLREHHPELADDYRRRYTRAYAPNAERAALAQTVRDLVERHRRRNVAAPTRMSSRFDRPSRGARSPRAARPLWRDDQPERPHSTP